MVKNLPAMQETRVQSLGWEDPLDEEMATHSSIVARIIPWMEEPSGLQCRVAQSSTRPKQFSTYVYMHMHVLCVYIYTHIHTYTSIYTHLYAYMYMCICVGMSVQVFYIYIYTYIRLHIYTFIYMCIYVLEKAMAPHSSPLAWKIPWTEEPGGLQSIGLLRVGNHWAISLSLFTFMHWRRKWQTTPVFLPGESQGRGSLVGCGLWGCTELDTTEWLSSNSSSIYVCLCAHECTHTHTHTLIMIFTLIYD